MDFHFDEKKAWLEQQRQQGQQREEERQRLEREDQDRKRRDDDERRKRDDDAKKLADDNKRKDDDQKRRDEDRRREQQRRKDDDAKLARLERAQKEEDAAAFAAPSRPDDPITPQARDQAAKFELNYRTSGEAYEDACAEIEVAAAFEKSGVNWKGRSPESAMEEHARNLPYADHATIAQAQENAALERLEEAHNRDNPSGYNDGKNNNDKPDDHDGGSGVPSEPKTPLDPIDRMALMHEKAMAERAKDPGDGHTFQEP